MESITKGLKSIFIEMVKLQNNAEKLRLEGLNHVPDRTRAKRLEDVFNAKMKELNKSDQKTVLYLLFYDGFLPDGIGKALDVFNGSFDSIQTSYHKIALEVLNDLETGLSPVDILKNSAKSIKEKGFSHDDFYKIMAEVRNIIHLH